MNGSEGASVTLEDYFEGPMLPREREAMRYASFRRNDSVTNVRGNYNQTGAAAVLGAGPTASRLSPVATPALLLRRLPGVYYTASLGC